MSKVDKTKKNYDIKHFHSQLTSHVELSYPSEHKTPIVKIQIFYLIYLFNNINIKLRRRKEKEKNEGV